MGGLATEEGSQQGCPSKVLLRPCLESTLSGSCSTGEAWVGFPARRGCPPAYPRPRPGEGQAACPVLLPEGTPPCHKQAGGRGTWRAALGPPTRISRTGWARMLD